MKKPWLACVLNIVLPGVGYIYVGNRVVFGILLFISNLIVWTSSVSLSEFSNSAIGIMVISGIVMIIAFAYDGYKDAQETNLHLK
ncbi:hypothetical protein A3B84_03015 [Candidatus Nomurabacteria bacterium RIFCSPHIGHO2_02_FULL_35_13]|uniref:DUF5683 domain-containing protein n=1 Tax=Candidatus Nomurabacteria bacterium RIFCSPHIGHO2_02_FULL_35_13 TaxID=1801748 RepID=A0A1F6VNE1_9BACT|nr:MAG: hypothetical protein A3B84_03015 [Candidatus Nomurabacteria bacterium RIFCSPHIGHO2_02_FULL_35_13]